MISTDYYFDKMIRKVQRSTRRKLREKWGDEYDSRLKFCRSLGKKCGDDFCLSLTQNGRVGDNYDYLLHLGANFGPTDGADPDKAKICLLVTELVADGRLFPALGAHMISNLFTVPAARN